MIGPDWRRMALNPPTSTDVLFWSEGQRDAGFRMMDRLPFLIKARTIEAGDTPRALERGAPIEFGFDIDAYMESQRHAALVILQDGKIRYENYGLGFTPEGRWTSFSVAKSFTSTLVGAAVKEGHIKSLDDKVSDYIEGLKGSAYDDVSIENLLTMQSGVAWNENYADPNSDVALFNDHEPEAGLSQIVSYMRSLPRAHAPGTFWNYSTGETNLIGELIKTATGRDLAEYLAQAVWKPYGMAQDATWLINKDGRELSGCCVQATTRDFARFGQFILDGAMINGESIVPDDWLAEATRNHADGLVMFERGYGYQWWTIGEDAFTAGGIFGQGIYIDPTRNLVIATNGNWTDALGQDGQRQGRRDFYGKVTAALDAELSQ